MARPRAPVVADLRAYLEREQQRGQPRGAAVQRVLAPDPLGTREKVLRWQCQREQVLAEHPVVLEDLLDLDDGAQRVRLRQPLELRLRHGVVEEDVVLAVARVRQLGRQRIHRRITRPHVHQALEVAHHVPCAVLNGVHEVYLVLQQVALRRTHRDNRRGVLVQQQHLDPRLLQHTGASGSA